MARSLARPLNATFIGAERRPRRISPLEMLGAAGPLGIDRTIQLAWYQHGDSMLLAAKQASTVHSLRKFL